MSVTFFSNAPSTVTTREEGCLCAQMAPGWPRELSHVAEHANPSCAICNGTGVETVADDDLPFVNLCNANAAAVLALLRLSENFDGNADGYYGEISISAARRAVMFARNTFDRRAPGLVRPAERVTGAPRVGPDGAVELHPLRISSPEFGIEDIRTRLDRFAAFVEESAARGATLVRWG